MRGTANPYALARDRPAHFVNAAHPSLAIINGASGFGRIVPVLAAQWVGFINIHMTFAVCSSIMLFCWTTADSVPGVLAFDATYGVISGESAFGL